MSIVSTCPKCHEQVTIPDGLEPEAEVRCPLCAVVYPLREALAEAPPALIPVETGAIEGPRPGSDALATSDLISEPFHVGESADVSGPLEIDAGTTGESSPAIDTGRTAVDADALATFRLEESADRSETADRGLSTRPRKKKKEKGAIRFMVEVFGGGILGLLMGYYVLCWLGPRHDLPRLPLPLLPHTMHWFAGAEKPENGAEQPPAEEPRAPQRQPQTQPQTEQPEPKNEDDLAPPDVPPAKPPAERPQPPTEGYVGPWPAPSFTSDELGKTLKAAHDALHDAGGTDEITAEAGLVQFRPFLGNRCEL